VGRSERAKSVVKKDKELEEQIGDVFARACKNNEYFGNDGWYELHTPTARQEINNLIAQERRKAKIEVLEWVYCNLPKRGDRFRNAKKTDLQEIIMGLDMDIAWEIAELKEDNKKGNNNE